MKMKSYRKKIIQGNLSLGPMSKLTQNLGSLIQSSVRYLPCNKPIEIKDPFLLKLLTQIFSLTKGKERIKRKIRILRRGSSLHAKMSSLMILELQSRSIMRPNMKKNKRKKLIFRNISLISNQLSKKKQKKIK